MALQKINHVSRYLMLNTSVIIAFPDCPADASPAEFYGQGKRMKALWLFHEAGEDASYYVRRIDVEQIANERRMAVIMPSLRNSGGRNWNDRESFIPYPLEEYLTKELMPMVYGWFPVSDRREDNYFACASPDEAVRISAIMADKAEQISI